MINFRYHFVGIAAVFLAVIVGLGLGAAALNGPVAGDLNGRGAQLRQTNDQLRGEVTEKDQQVSGQEKFVAQVAPGLLGKRLAGKKVLVVTAPGAKPVDRAGVRRMLTAAGAAVSGDLLINESFVDPTRNDDQLDLSQRLLPPTVRGLPNNSSGVETASALLARVFAVGKEPVTDADRTALIAGFSQLKMVTGSPETIGAADAVVLLTGPPLTGPDSAKKNAGVLTMVKQFDAAFGPTVLAGSTVSGAGNALHAVRTTPALAAAMSTTDSADTAQGQVATAMAVVEQFARKSGHYGFTTGATSVLPALPPV